MLNNNPTQSPSWSQRVQPAWPWLSLLARFYLGTIFILAGIGKILKPIIFFQSVHAYQLLPLAWEGVITLCLPWLEVLVAIALFTGMFVYESSILASLLLLVLMGGAASAMVRHLDISCGCFDVWGKGAPISGQTFVRDGFWLVLSLMIFLKDRRPIKLWQIPRAKITVLGSFLMALLLSFATLHAALPDVLDPDVKDIRLGGVPFLGNSHPKHTLVVYACYTCPHCRKQIPAIMAAIGNGQLNQYQFFWKVWPLRVGERSKPAAQAMLAASRQNKFWNYFMILLNDPGNVDEAYLVASAKKAGLDMAMFNIDRDVFAIKQDMLQSKLEGVKNGVNQTPTYFVDGHMYIGSKKTDDLLKFLRSY